MANEKILIVDDEKPINDLLSSYMMKEQFVPMQAYDGEQALEIVREHNPDLILLDVMLPDIEGTELCLEIRKTTDVPILFVSCKSEELDKIIALSAGGDDYITKPFLPGELIARIKANLRRHRSVFAAQSEHDEDTTIYEFPNLRINVNTHEVYVGGEPVSLTAKEFDILRLLVENPKKIFSAEQIFEAIWKTPCLMSDTKTVMVYISTLRKKIEPSPDLPKYIVNLRGVGYIFNQALLEDAGK